MTEVGVISNYNPFGKIKTCNPARLGVADWEEVAEATLIDQGYGFSSLTLAQQKELIGLLAARIKKANGDREKPFPDALTNPSSSYKRYQWTQCPEGALSWLPDSGAAPGITLPDGMISKLYNDYMDKVGTPKIIAISPPDAEAGKTVVFSIEGENFGSSPTITVDSKDAKLVPSPQNACLNNDRLQVITLEISKDAKPGAEIPIKITVGKKSATVKITVLERQFTRKEETLTPTLAISSPSYVAQGKAQIFTITGGQYFEKGQTTVTAEGTLTGATVGFEIVDPKTIKVTVSTTPQTPIGPYTLYIRTVAEIKDEAKGEIKVITETGSVRFAVTPRPAVTGTTVIKPPVKKPAKTPEIDFGSSGSQP